VGALVLSGRMVGATGARVRGWMGERTGSGDLAGALVGALMGVRVGCLDATTGDAVGATRGGGSLLTGARVGVILGTMGAGMGAAMGTTGRLRRGQRPHFHPRSK
jgi:hypothetical protein